MKDKSAKSMVDNIFTISNRMPHTLQGDKDKEFVNRKFKIHFEKITECTSFPRKMTTSTPA